MYQVNALIPLSSTWSPSLVGVVWRRHSPFDSQWGQMGSAAPDTKHSDWDGMKTRTVIEVCCSSVIGDRKRQPDQVNRFREVGTHQEPTNTSKQPIRTRYLGHMTGYQPIRDQYFLIRSVAGQ
eukprot:sb/3475903/